MADVTTPRATAAPEESLWHGTDRRTRDDGRRARLLDAALELYGTAGFRATSVKAVCTLAAVSTRSFYELYPGQEELLAQLYRELNGEVLAGLAGARVAVARGLAGAVRGLVTASLSPMLRDERKARVLEVESVGVSAELESQRRAAYRAFAAAIDAAFAVLADAGLIRQAPGGLASLVLVGGVTEALVQRVQAEAAERESDEAFLDAVTEVVLRLLGAAS